MASPHRATVLLHVGPVADPRKHAALLQALRDLAGVLQVVADTVGGSYRIDFDPSLIGVPALVGCLAGHGMPASRAELLDDDPSTALG